MHGVLSSLCLGDVAKDSMLLVGWRRRVWAGEKFFFPLLQRLPDYLVPLAGCRLRRILGAGHQTVQCHHTRAHVRFRVKIGNRQSGSATASSSRPSTQPRRIAGAGSR
jgi:hypothetical protein